MTYSLSNPSLISPSLCRSPDLKMASTSKLFFLSTVVLALSMASMAVSRPLDLDTSPTLGARLKLDGESTIIAAHSPPPSPPLPPSLPSSLLMLSSPPPPAPSSTICWDSLLALQACTGEVVMFFLNGETYLGPSCCQAIRVIEHECWPEMFLSLGFTTQEGDILEGYCEAAAHSPPPLPPLPLLPLSPPPSLSPSLPSSTICWDSLLALQACTGEIVMFFLNGEIYLGPSCCQAIRVIEHQCWPEMFISLGFTTQEGDILERYCT
jgi:hypothetical protein